MACLQVVASEALPCSVEAACLKALRCCSKAVFIPGCACGAFSVIFVKQASYFLMYSSHSATPTLSVEAVSAFVVFADLLTTTALLLPPVVGVLLQFVKKKTPQ